MAPRGEQTRLAGTTSFHPRRIRQKVAATLAAGSQTCAIVSFVLRPSALADGRQAQMPFAVPPWPGRGWRGGVRSALPSKRRGFIYGSSHRRTGSGAAAAISVGEHWTLAAIPLGEARAQDAMRQSHGLDWPEPSPLVRGPPPSPSSFQGTPARAAAAAAAAALGGPRRPAGPAPRGARRAGGPAASCGKVAACGNMC